MAVQSQHDLHNEMRAWLGDLCAGSRVTCSMLLYFCGRQRVHIQCDIVIFFTVCAFLVGSLSRGGLLQNPACVAQGQTHRLDGDDEEVWQQQDEPFSGALRQRAGGGAGYVILSRVSGGGTHARADCPGSGGLSLPLSLSPSLSRAQPHLDVIKGSELAGDEWHGGASGPGRSWRCHGAHR